MQVSTNGKSRSIKNEENILAKVRHHLRQAVESGCVGEIGFRCNLGRGGGVRCVKINLKIEYDFLEDVDAL